jgi:hypothetical protein
MLKQDQVQGLKARFPAEALSADTSRGFELTSIKAAYVVERLNEVFGLCGTGWRRVGTASRKPDVGSRAAPASPARAAHPGRATVGP